MNYQPTQNTHKRRKTKGLSHFALFLGFIDYAADRHSNSRKAPIYKAPERLICYLWEVYHKKLTKS